MNKINNSHISYTKWTSNLIRNGRPIKLNEHLLVTVMTGIVESTSLLKIGK